MDRSSTAPSFPRTHTTVPEPGALSFAPMVDDLTRRLDKPHDVPYYHGRGNGMRFHIMENAYWDVVWTLEVLAGDGYVAGRIEWAEIGNGRGSEDKGKG